MKMALTIALTFLSEILVGQVNSNSSIWSYDCFSSKAVKNQNVNPDTLTPITLIKFINSHSNNKIHLDFIKVSYDTIYIKIKESTYLTQSIGTCGADDYMVTTTYTLTELKNIKYVNFNFEEGDHAMPGTYSRQYYLDRNKEKNEK